VSNTNYPWFTNDHQHSPQMVQWFKDAGRDYDDGSSYPKFLAHFRSAATNALSDDEKTALAALIVEHTNEVAKAEVKRNFVKDWKMEDVQPALEQVAKSRSFVKGKEVFTAAQCIQCHRFGSEGGAVGPELTAISSRFGHRDILESILEPSKVVSEQYQNTTVIKKDGDDVTGRVVEENDQKVVLITNPLKPDKTEVLKSDIEKRQASKISPMPEGLMNSFTKEEILDLIAYMESGGKEDAAAFKP